MHDIGYFFVATRLYSAGLAVLTETVKILTRPQEATILWGSIARAAAGAQDARAYAEARDRALQMQERYPEHAPATLRNVAYAAQLAGEWDVAEQAAAKAAELARARRMEDIERTAVGLLESVRDRQPGAVEVQPPADSHVGEVVTMCKTRVARWGGPRRGRPPGQTPPS